MYSEIIDTTMQDDKNLSKTISEVSDNLKELGPLLKTSAPNTAATTLKREPPTSLQSRKTVGPSEVSFGIPDTIQKPEPKCSSFRMITIMMLMLIIAFFFTYFNLADFTN